MLRSKPDSLTVSSAVVCTAIILVADAILVRSGHESFTRMARRSTALTGMIEVYLFLHFWGKPKAFHDHDPLHLIAHRLEKH